MMKEEKILKDKFGKESHFTVPSGYFDSFADQLMEQLPETEHRTIVMHAQSWWHHIQWGKVAAAITAVMLLGGGSMFYLGQTHPSHAQMASKYEHSSQPNNAEYGTFEQMADYAMVDNQDIYASLVAEN